MQFKAFDIIPNDTKIDFVGLRTITVSLSIILCLAIIGWSVFHGLNFGVDFAGGMEMEIRLDAGVDPATIRKTVEGLGFDDASVQSYGPRETVEIKDPATGAKKQVVQQSYLVRIGRTTTLTQQDADRLVGVVKSKFKVFDASFNPEMGDNLNFQFHGDPPASDALRQAIEEAGVKVREIREQPGLAAGSKAFVVIPAGIQEKIEPKLAATFNVEKPVVRVEFVGPAVGRELRNQGFKAIIYAILLIMIYVGFRFEFRFAPGVVIALIHDAIVTVGYYAFSGREFNLTSVAVILTIVGYSVNDTVVIYDRIRENMGRFKGKRLAELVNLSINEVLGRTFLTSLATALSIVGLLIYGVGTIFDFAAAMFFGMISGVYSTWFLAAPITIWLGDWFAARKEARNRHPAALESKSKP